VKTIPEYDLSQAVFGQSGGNSSTRLSALARPLIALP
jgi:hypothetical protein